jgi:hypothetical protein
MPGGTWFYNNGTNAKTQPRTGMTSHAPTSNLKIHGAPKTFPFGEGGTAKP